MKIWDRAGKTKSGRQAKGPDARPSGNATRETGSKLSAQFSVADWPSREPVPAKKTGKQQAKRWIGADTLELSPAGSEGNHRAKETKPTKMQTGALFPNLRQEWRTHQGSKFLPWNQKIQSKNQERQLLQRQIETGSNPSLMTTNWDRGSGFNHWMSWAQAKNHTRSAKKHEHMGTQI
jgi:hypothetical protein